MKKKCLFLFCALLLMAGCASQNQKTVALPTLQQTNPEQLGDRDFLISVIAKKIAGLKTSSLEAVNDFIDSHLKAEGKDLKLLILTIDAKLFPFFLEGVMKSNKLLSALPREKERLIIVESEKAPGVRNVYYQVNAEEVPDNKQFIGNWAPSQIAFKKHIDPEENLIGSKTPDEQFLSLFYQGNMHHNPELILSVQGVDNAWDWTRMVHPKKTTTRIMLIPIATVKNGAMETLLQ